jgi:hypothetical protein
MVLDRLLDKLQEHPVLFTAGGALGGTASGVDLQNAIDGKIFGQHPMLGIGIGVIGIALCTAMTALVTERTKTRRSERTKTKVIQKLLCALACFCGHPRQHVRANIMLADAARRRRKVDHATAFNMAPDPDVDLEVAFTAGVSGKAARERKAVLGDLTIRPVQTGPDWGLSPSEQALVRRELKTILSVPIPDPNDPDAPILGTLQVDSDHTIDELKWGLEEAEQAQTFADLVGLHLRNKP